MDPKWIGVVAPIVLLVGLFFIDGGVAWAVFLTVMFFLGIVLSNSALPEWMTGWLLYGWLFLNVLGLVGCLIDVWPKIKGKNPNIKV
ncbi:TPA: hypothetical protein ACRNJF_004113 [Pseudomonas aeruginosa]